jgi:hypothetical protein
MYLYVGYCLFQIYLFECLEIYGAKSNIFLIEFHFSLPTHNGQVSSTGSMSGFHLIRTLFKLPLELRSFPVVRGSPQSFSEIS